MFRRPMLSVVFLLTISATALYADEPADLVLHHGKIVTVDPQFRIVEAAAIRGERILAVGGNDEIRKLAGPNTRQVDLQGKTVLPGLIDSHAHPDMASVYEFDHPVPEMETIADVLRYYKSRAAVVPEGQWLSLEQVFITRLRDQRYPTRQELDEAAPRHPIAYRTGPDAVLNSAGPETLRHRQELPDHRRFFGHRRARPGHAGAHRHAAQLRPVHQVQVVEQDAHHRPAARLPADALGQLQRRGHYRRGRPEDQRRLDRAVSAVEGPRRAYLPHVSHLLRRCPDAVGQGRDRHPSRRPPSAAPVRQPALAPRRENLSRRRHAHRQRLHAPAVGREQNLCDHRSAVPRAEVRRTGTPLQDRQADARKRPAIDRAHRRRRRGATP